jgi:hypothetical protein
MRVRVSAGATASAVSKATPPVRAGAVTTAQLRLDLARQLTPRRRAAQTGPLLERGVTTLPFRALAAGRLTISWYRPARARAKPLLVARGTRRFSGPLVTTITVRLTAGGRRVLRRSGRLRLTASATFRSRPASATVRAARAIVIAP